VSELERKKGREVEGERGREKERERGREEERESGREEERERGKNLACKSAASEADKHASLALCNNVKALPIH